MTQEQRITRITVGIDEQGAADDAVRAGFSLAGALDASLDLVHAVRVELPPWVEHVLPHHPKLAWNVLLAAKNACISRLHEWVDREQLGSPADLLTVEQGRPSKVIVDHALAHESDLIILGRHRHHGVLHIGSTARSVLASSRCPVWVQTGPVVKIGHILAAIDMSPESNLVLGLVRSLASRLSAKVCAVHSFEPPHFPYRTPAAAFDTPADYGFEDFKAAEREEFDRSVADLEWGDVEVEARFSRGNPAETILAMQDATDLIVMGTHGRTGLSRALLGSQAYTVVKRAHVPVLAVPNPERDFPQ